MNREMMEHTATELTKALIIARPEIVESTNPIPGMVALRQDVLWQVESHEKEKSARE